MCVCSPVLAPHQAWSLSACTCPAVRGTRVGRGPRGGRGGARECFLCVCAISRQASGRGGAPASRSPRMRCPGGAHSRAPPRPLRYRLALAFPRSWKPVGLTHVPARAANDGAACAPAGPASPPKKTRGRGPARRVGTAPRGVTARGGVWDAPSRARPGACPPAAAAGRDPWAHARMDAAHAGGIKVTGRSAPPPRPRDLSHPKIGNPSPLVFFFLVHRERGGTAPSRPRPRTASPRQPTLPGVRACVWPLSSHPPIPRGNKKRGTHSR